MQLDAEELAKQDQDCGVTPSTERKTVSFTGLGEKPDRSGKGGNEPRHCLGQVLPGGGLCGLLKMPRIEGKR